METRTPNSQEINQWNRFRKRFEGSVAPKIKGLVLLAQIARSAENKIAEITGGNPDIITDEQTAIISEIGRRGAIIDRQITGVLTQKYGVQWNENGLNIVGSGAPESDIYPRNGLEFGIVPWLVVAGIAAVVLLMSGDQVVEGLSKKSETEAVKLQRRLVDADIEMMKRPEADRKRWEKWKAESAKAARAALRDSPETPSWFGHIFGEKSTSILIAGAVGIAAVYFLVPMMRRN